MDEQRLWAPWRMAYIASHQLEEQSSSSQRPLLPGGIATCFLCRAAAEPSGPDDERQHLVVARGEHDLVVLNRYPYNNGHLLISPRAHQARLGELSAATHAALMARLTQLTEVLEALMEAQGFNVGLNLGSVAGAGVPGHLHWHLVPRWQGDHNFMPTVASTRVIPQSLEELWEALALALGSGH